MKLRQTDRPTDRPTDGQTRGHWEVTLPVITVIVSDICIGVEIFASLLFSLTNKTAHSKLKWFWNQTIQVGNNDRRTNKPTNQPKDKSGHREVTLPTIISGTRCYKISDVQTKGGGHENLDKKHILPSFLQVHIKPVTTSSIQPRLVTTYLAQL